jgi:hypothetical protein
MSDSLRRSARLSSTKQAAGPSQQVELLADSTRPRLELEPSAMNGEAGALGMGVNAELDYKPSALTNSDGEYKPASSSDQKPTKRTKWSHTSHPGDDTNLTFFADQKKERQKMKGFPFTSFPLDVVIEVSIDFDKALFR